MAKQTAYDWFVMAYTKKGYKSMNEFARKKGFHKSSLSRYFRRERFMPADTIAKLCYALDVTPNELLIALGDYKAKNKA